MPDGNGTPSKVKGSSQGGSSQGDSSTATAQHDRKMASTGAGRAIAVELVSLNSRKTTFKGGRYIVLEGRVLPDRAERKEITLWNEVADQFTALTSFVKPTGQQPLVVTFQGAYRKKDAYFADRDARLESWVFNAKGFEIDWRSPAGKAQYPATLSLNVTDFQQHTSKVSGLPIWVMTGTATAKEKLKVSTQGAACDAVTSIVDRLKKADLAGQDKHLQFDLKGYWRMVERKAGGGFSKLFTAQSVENMRQLEAATQPRRVPKQAEQHRAAAL